MLTPHQPSTNLPKENQPVEKDDEFARVMSNFVDVPNLSGNFNDIVNFYCQTLSTAKHAGDKAREGAVYSTLGGLFLDQCDYKKAKEYNYLALDIFKELGNKRQEGYVCQCLGDVFQELCNFEKAMEYQNRALSIAIDLGEKPLEGSAYYGLGNASRGLCRYDKAIGFYNRYHSVAKGLADKTIGRPLEGVACSNLGHASSSTIFLSLSENKINIWLLLKEKPVLHRQKTLYHHFAENAAAETLQSLIEFAYENNGVRANVNCENRSLEVLRENCYTVERSSKKFSQQILQEDNPPLAALYSYVIAPILDLIEGDELIIVPDGPLWLAPFAALLNPFSKYLCESFKVRLIPSLTSLKIIAHCPKFHCRSGALVVGDPDMVEVTNSQGDQILEQLPFARQESQMIGQILNTAPLTGKLATKCEVLKQISSVAVVHIAAHGRMETGEITDPCRRGSRDNNGRCDECNAASQASCP